MIAIFSLLVIVLIGLIITRVATAALVSTGLSRESARFQARSAFTGSGFTTSEAETVVNHPVRRRVVMTLMLLGNAGIATLVAGLLLGLGGARASGGLALRLGILAGGLFCIILLARSRWVDMRLRRLIGFVLRRTTDIEVRDYAQILHVAGEYVIDELLVEESDWMCGRTLGDLRLRDEGIVVLGIERGNQYHGTPAGDTTLQADDALVIYGRRGVIRDLDLRGPGTLGDLAHSERSQEHRRAHELDDLSLDVNAADQDAAGVEDQAAVTAATAVSRAGPPPAHPGD